MRRLRRRLALLILPSVDRQAVRTAATTIDTFELMLANGVSGHTGGEAMLHKRQGIYEDIIRGLLADRVAS